VFDRMALLVLSLTQSENSIGVLLPRMAKRHAAMRDGEAGASPALTRNGKRAACVRPASPVDRPRLSEFRPSRIGVGASPERIRCDASTAVLAAACLQPGQAGRVLLFPFLVHRPAKHDG
jgi:hypothetical protein